MNSAQRVTATAAPRFCVRGSMPPQRAGGREGFRWGQGSGETATVAVAVNSASPASSLT